MTTAIVITYLVVAALIGERAYYLFDDEPDEDAKAFAAVIGLTWPLWLTLLSLLSAAIAVLTAIAPLLFIVALCVASIYHLLVVLVRRLILGKRKIPYVSM